MSVNYKKTSVSILVVALLMFILSTVWKLYVVDYFLPESLSNLRAEIVYTSIFVGYLLLAFLMSIMYQFYNVNYSRLKKGMTFGIFIALIWMVPANIILHAVYIVPDFTLYIDVAWALIEQGLGGLAMVYIMESGTI